jgi:hypothetical protein
MRRLFPVITWAAMLTLAGCGHDPVAGLPVGAPVDRTIAAAAIDALPRDSVSDGRLICASDGGNACPLNIAAANWLHGGRFATWEPNRVVEVWSPGVPDPQALGDVGPAENQYGYAVAVGQLGREYVVLDAQQMHALRYDEKGTFRSWLPIPPVSVRHAIGFARDLVVLQTVTASSPDSVGEFEVRELDTPGDTLGHSMLKVRVPWFVMRNGRLAQAMPLFPALPSYAFAADSDIIWSAGDSLTVERRSSSGAVRWITRSGATGATVTPDEVVQMRTQIVTSPDPQARAVFDSTVAHTGKTHPAITGILTAADDRILIVGSASPVRDSVDLITLRADGTPAARFALPRRSRVLLFAGDSLVVQRPGPGMHQEMRWLQLHHH